MGWKINLRNRAILSELEPEMKNNLTPVAESEVTAEIRTKLQDAARLVPIMVGAAVQSIGRHRRNPEVLTALHKYFNLAPDDPNHTWVSQRITAVYRATLDGLMKEYNLYLFSPDAKRERTKALVQAPAPKGSEALGRFFLADDNGHIDWKTMQAVAYQGTNVVPLERRGIHLNIKYVSDPEYAADAIARTIVHEATHKWANTDDVCYKHSTFSKLALENKELLDVVTTGFSRYGEFLEEKSGKLRATFTKMSGTKPVNVPAYNKNSFKVGAESWVKNADSYAWAARRLWKKTEKVLVNL